MMRKNWCWDFPGGPVIKSLPSKAGVPVLFLVGELRSHRSLGPNSKQTNIKQKQYCKKLNKDLKNGPLKKI